MVEGTRKAALFLLSLDPAAASELLKSARPETATAIAAELEYIRSAGQGNPAASAQTMREFFVQLHSSRGPVKPEQFLREVLAGAFGPARAKDLLAQAQGLAEQRDPFLSIRQADVRELAAALAGESAQVAALLLTELPPAKSTQMLPLLEAAVRAEAVHGMASGLPVPAEAKARVARMVVQRLAANRRQSGGETAGAPSRDQQLRKVALLLRGLAREMRDNMLTAIRQKDAPAADSIKRLMVIWEDLSAVSDRNLQQVLRAVDSRTLAMALWQSEASIGEKIRANISDRARAMLDEEASLLSAPKAADVEQARQEVLAALRELNDAGELDFKEAT